MRHVSWIIALVIGFSVGFFSRGAIDGGGARAPAGRRGAAAAGTAGRGSSAVYRVPWTTRRSAAPRTRSSRSSSRPTSSARSASASVRR